MTEVARLLYAGVVIGVPLLYLVLRGRRQWRRVPLPGIAAAVGLLLLPSQALPFLWLLLLTVMGAGVTIFAIFNGLSIYLVFGRRPACDAPVARTAREITVLVPAKDEASVIAGCLDAISRSAYPSDRVKVVVIDDGSTDGTAETARAYEGDRHKVRVVVRSPSATRGKAAALNELISTVDTELTCILDADHQVAETFFAQVVRAFDVPRVGGVQGRISGRNWSENLLTRLMALELLGWQAITSGMPVSFGSACVYRTELLQRLGGFNNDLATEDFEFSFRVYEAGYRIAFEPAALATDELVSDYRSFFRQRYRWARGTIHAVRLHCLSFFTAGRATWREKLDFFFYPLLLCMMIVPYLQLFTHARASVANVSLPLASLAPLSYGLLTLLIYLVAGLRIRQDGEGVGSQGLFQLILLDIAMGAYYCLLNLPITIKAFIDEFVLGLPYRKSKTEHSGGTRPHRAARLSASRFSRPSPEEQILLRLGGQTPVAHDRVDSSVLHDVDWARVEELAKFHGVAGFVHSNLVRHNLGDSIRPDVRDSLLLYRRTVLARNLLLQYAWREIVQALSGAKIETIPLKGIYFLERVYPPDVRPLHDLDFLVKPTRVEKAARALRSLDYEETQNRAPAGTEWRTQRCFRHPATGVPIDLHWDLINMSAYNKIYTFPIADVWRRAHPSEDNPFVYEMAPEDRVLHSALHSAIHHGFTTLSQLVDLAEVVRVSAPALDWGRLVNLAANSRIKTPVYCALTLCRELSGTTVPDSVLQALEAPPYRRLCFHGYLRCQRMSLDKRRWGVAKAIWGRELKWAGLASVILADNFVDSVRVIGATLTLIVSKGGWLRARSQPPWSAGRSA